jgi:hypothetical protein
MSHIDPYNPNYDPYARRAEYEYMNRAYSGTSGLGALIALALLIGFIVLAVAFGSREPGTSTSNPTLTPPITQPAPPATLPRAPNG